MTDKIDVLAAMDSVYVTQNDRYPEMAKARAAIAELIEAAKFARTSGNGPAGYTLGVDRRLAAALANVTGA